ncbi:hypothetical protein J6590_080458 [Homalodisca vitripennis]|nr:hypothetical protein J6590_080458 [Homalodisca vitripennis]
MPVHTERARANKLQRCSSKYRHQSDRVGGFSRVREAARFAVHTKCAARRAHVLRSAAQLCAFGVDVAIRGICPETRVKQPKHDRHSHSTEAHCELVSSPVGALVSLLRPLRHLSARVIGPDFTLYLLL